MSSWGKWWYIRRGTMALILALFLLPAWGRWSLLQGNYSASTLLGIIPMADPLAAAQAFLATGGLGQKALIGAAVVTVFYLLAGGRAFCGWVCPLGALMDLAHWLSGMLAIRKPFAGFPSVTRWYLLASMIIAPAISGVALYELYNPISIFHRTLLFYGAGIGMGSAMLVAVMFLYELALARAGWCKTLCPLGAFYILLGRVSPMRVEASTSAPAELARLMGETCPEPGAIAGVLGREPFNGECTLCGACVDKSGGAARFKWKLTHS